MKLTCFFFIFFLDQICFSQINNSIMNNLKKIEISDNWYFRKVGDTLWLKAEVPGCVHTDLLRNKIIEDPYYGNNESKVQWIENEDWEYKSYIIVNEEHFSCKNIELLFEGLDTYTEIYLNDSIISTTNNMFRRWKIDCKKYLHIGENELRIKILSPAKMSGNIYSKIGYELPGGSQVATRKAPYNFGWDWNGRFLTSGIFRKVYLQFWNNVLINDIHLTTEIIEEKRAILNAKIEINSNCEGLLTIVVTYKDKMLRKKDFTLNNILNEYEVDFEIPNAKLWWPNGYGEQWLYDFKFQIFVKNELIDEKTVRYGIRKCQVVQEKDSVGASFFFKINDVPIFMKGANYIPQDNFLANVTNDKYENLIKNVKDANMNMLRVWGGGIYEDDYFYELCDENGILVWQDFMFACAMYPGNEEFLVNVKEEAIDNVKRLRNHISIVLWCGNNEIHEAWHNWGWQDTYTSEQKEKIWNDYQKIFHEILPSVIAEYDSGKFYWPSSPKYGRGNPLSKYEGDSHYWGVWHDNEPFEVYNISVGRFMSEYGFQSFPDRSTIDSITTIKDLHSEELQTHQKNSRGFQILNDYMNRYYFCPENFNEYLYISQIMQAEGIKTAIESHRRAKPYCMGTLYWQLNDCWPVISWSSLDYYQNWKALHYFVKKLYQPVILSTVIKDEKIEIYSISDLLKGFHGKLTISVEDFSGDILFSKDTNVLIKANTSRVIFSSRIPDSLINIDKKSNILRIRLFGKDKIIYEDLRYFDAPHKLNLKKPIISFISYDPKNGYDITISSNTLIKNLCMYLENENVKFSDNYFDLLPNQEKKFSIQTSLSLDKVKKKLKMISFNWLSPNTN